MCHYLGAGLHGKQKRVKAQSESSKSVVNSVLISREMPVFPGFLEIIRVVDLNNLKCANDTYGHAVGDQLITNFARLLRNAIPAKDFVGRYGGDEFIAIITQTTKNEILKIMDEVHDEVRHFNENIHKVEVSYAYGYAFFRRLC